MQFLKLGYWLVLGEANGEQAQETGEGSAYEGLLKDGTGSVFWGTELAGLTCTAAVYPSLKAHVVISPNLTV